MVELMLASGSYSTSFAQALMVGTPKEQLVEPDKTKKPVSLKPEDLSRMEHEMRALEKELFLIEESYGRNVVDLTSRAGI
jgi:hypothetical protein